MKLNILIFSKRIKFLFYIFIIFISAFISGRAIHAYLNLQHPAYTPSNNIVYLTIVVFFIVFFCLWIFLPYLFLGKITNIENLSIIRRNDAYTYISLYFLYFYKFSYMVPSLLIFVFLLSKFFVFIKYKKIILNRLEMLWINILEFPQNFIDNINKIATKFFFDKEKHDSSINKILLILKIILVFYVGLICFSRLHQIYSIPLNQPYFAPSWDESVSVNSGLNILHTKGDAGFYFYGGTSSIPYAISFYLYSKKHQINPYYKMMGEKFFQPHNSLSKDIYPTKPIYYARIAVIILFTLGIFLFISLFTWYLLPIPFLLFKIIDYSSIFNGSIPVLLGNSEVALLAGFTALFFILTLLTNEQKKYFKYLIICFIFSSMTIAAKLSSAFIIFLPISLLIHMYKTKIFDRDKLSRNNTFLKCSLALIVPYIIINPAILLNTFNFFSKMRYLIFQPGAGVEIPFQWMTNINQVFGFINNLYLIATVPNILLILFAIIASFLMIRISPIAFGAYVFFHLYSFSKILNISYLGLYSRLFIFLLLTHIFFILFPFIYFYRHEKFSKYLKVIVLIISILFTLKFYPISTVNEGFAKFRNGNFATWTKDSRDDFEEYVEKNNLEIYFYDCHNFSLPENIHNRLLFFDKFEDLPKRLGVNQKIAFIKYRDGESIFSDRDPDGTKTKKYWNMIKYLQENYILCKSFGDEIPNYGFGTDAPAGNPTILLLSQK
jgi:hypothetical protein